MSDLEHRFTSITGLGPNQRAWVNALRSGAYQQGKRFLRTHSGYCCLGVASDVMDSTRWKLGPNPKSDQRDGAMVYYFGGVPDMISLPVSPYDNACYLLTKEMTDWLAMTTDNGAYSFNVPFIGLIEGALTERNDSGWTFAQIADLLETHPTVFFKEPK